MNTATAERRRSDRIWLTIPVRVEGTDSNGQTFQCEGRAISLSRHGARVQIPRSLNKGQALRLKSPTGEYEEEFKVVASIVLPGEKDGEYGVECLDEKANFWGIEFPISDKGETTGAKVLLECRKCETIALLPLMLSEVEALRAMGWVGKACQTCAAVSLWKYAQVGMSPDRALEAGQGLTPQNSTAEPSDSDPSATESAARGHRRIYVLMPLGVRDAHGSEELTRTENISKGGFCFTSEKQYQPGEVIIAVFPHDSAERKTELPAQIVREWPIEGSNRKLYGAAYHHA